jgi:glycosyltransferase involved in cell wall biosynthesis
MKSILLGINSLKQLGGSETYTFTLAEELVRSGYEVDVHTLENGEVSQKMSEIARLLDLPDIRKKKYDLALISQNMHLLIPIRAKRIIQICHGIYPKLESPSFMAHGHVAVSEEVKDALRLKGFDSVVINNFVNQERFRPTSPIHKECRRVLSLCHGIEANQLIHSACHDLGLEFVNYSKYSGAVWNIEDEINKADLVISVGRGVKESMSCGRAVIVYDHRPYSVDYDGMLTPDIIDLSLSCNFSGRALKRKFVREGLMEEIRKYNPSMGDYNLMYAREHFDVRKIVPRLLNYAENLRDSDSLARNKKKWLSSYNKSIIREEKSGKSYFAFRATLFELSDDDTLSGVKKRLRLKKMKIHEPGEEELAMLPVIPIYMLYRYYLQEWFQKKSYMQKGIEIFRRLLNSYK